MQEKEEGEVGFVIEEELQEWQEALYQMELGEGTEKKDEGVWESVLKGLNKMREGLWQQREGIVKQEEGLAEIIQVVTNTPIRSLGPVLESLVPTRPSSQGAPSVDMPSSSACLPTQHILPPLHVHPALQIPQLCRSSHPCTSCHPFRSHYCAWARGIICR